MNSGSLNKSKTKIRPGTASMANTSSVKKNRDMDITQNEQVEFQQNIEMLSMQERPMSSKQKQDSFMSDDKENAPEINEH